MYRRIAAIWLSSIIIISLVVFTIEITPLVRATIIYVNVDGGADYTSIQDAINASNDGDTVYVYGGIYFEDIVISKSITILGENRDITMIDTNGTGNGIYVNASFVDVKGFTVSNSGTNYFDAGIHLDKVQGCNISNNYLSNNKYGVLLYNSDWNHLSGNNASNNVCGLCLRSSNSNNIFNNNLFLNEIEGIYLASANNNNIKNNNASNNNYGIYLETSSYNNIISNIAVSNTKDGLSLDSDFVLNTSNGNKIFDNIAISNERYGISLFSYSTNNMIKNNSVLHNYHGISVWRSFNNSVEKNRASNNIDGIHLHDSWFNNVTGNMISLNSDDGISIIFSWDNNISNNIVSLNDNGISLYDATNNVVFHNNFIDNTNQTYEDMWSNNSWNNSYPSGGNYWSDYTGEDKNGGQNQDQPGSDGIGDTPYVIDSDSQDNYPLIEPILFLEMDISSPSVFLISLDKNASNVPVNTEIMIEFNEPMNIESVDSAISIEPYEKFSCSWSNDNQTLTITFSELLSYKTLYQLSIEPTAEDLAGNKLDDMFEFEFTTEEKPKEGKGDLLRNSFFFILVLALISVIIIAILIIVFVISKNKKKTKLDNILNVPIFPSIDQISCPECNYIFDIPSELRPLAMQCPKCGAKGIVR